jgi:hypothetical protein
MDKRSISYCARKVFTKSSPMTLTFDQLTSTSIGFVGSVYLTHTRTHTKCNKYNRSYSTRKVLQSPLLWPWPLTYWLSLVTIGQVQLKLLHSQSFYKVCSSDLDLCTPKSMTIGFLGSACNIHKHPTLSCQAHRLRRGKILNSDCVWSG